ncbi:methylmalonyl Co-A mutase-associated GTPase MeaB [Sanyastnella coralliicola]|uniref:methylmalonyl Co-A mutase-associated GTPase MeaB n=1 Tax=Sanyastnella coralliicola TaxID=3069118 RepID=UPI0027BABC27|nr:methylmalonyl Co-A mutase-associated GTPase MeaB [Longitalea sp. SCSIO 12813]
MSEGTGNARQRAIEKIRKERAERGNIQVLFDELKTGKRDALSKAITIIESHREEDREPADALLSLCLPFSGNSRRIGITGVPGVGKSTFIESFGMALIGRGHQVAVLAIDPSSQRSGGSILGDKTRMEQLSRAPEAFVRPSPAADTLGGVARATRESIVLCEAAGYDTIIVETVGVGQSETAVNDMVDFFLLLMLAGAGDELQGIKRGIMEMADSMLITKADGDNAKKAINAKRQYKAALHLYPPSDNDWVTQVELCSALENTGVDEFVEQCSTYFEHITSNGWKSRHREEQDLAWFNDAIKSELLRSFSSDPSLAEEMVKMREMIGAKKLSPFAAAHQLVKKFQGK